MWKQLYAGERCCGGLEDLFDPQSAAGEVEGGTLVDLFSSNVERGQRVTDGVNTTR
jgi:hypothetical protein